MNVATVTVNVLALAALVWAVIKDRERTKQALRIALRSFVGMLPMVLTIIILIGVLLGFVTQDVIRRLLGEESGFLGILTSAVVGGVMFIPSLIAFPLAASLLEGGAAVGTVAGFIASLTMIGVVSLPVEVRELGVKMTVLRNGLGFLFAPAIVILIGLFAVFVPKQMVADYLGHASGLKGFLLAALLGSLPTGPLYVAFPLAAAMLKKGARIATIIVFLTAWACIKLPQEMVEL